MSKLRTALPLLAFGNETAIVNEDTRTFGELIDKVFPGLNAYDSTAEGGFFRSKSSMLRMSSSTIVASAISPTNVDRKGNQYLTFIVPMTGEDRAYAQVGHDRVDWGVRLGGVFMPVTDQRVLGIGGFRSQIMWQLQEEQLQKTAMAMTASQGPVELYLDQLRLLPKTIAGVRVDASLSAVMPLLQLHVQNSHYLEHLGVEDLIYRQSVMLLRPDLFESHSAAHQVYGQAGRRTRAVISALCEYILAHLSEPLTLTALEQFSGLSARSLQLEFQRRFKCSPMVWIREQRLLKVRQKLQLKPEASVEAVAFGAGFRTMPSFFAAYRKRFGETPGQTRRY